MTPSPELTVHVNYAISRKGIPAQRSFAHWVRATVEKVRSHKASELSIRLVDIPEGRRLNKQYRHKDYATNVLSFPVELPEEVDVPLIGDLAICVPVVRQEAIEQNKLEKNHFAHLTIHGVLHLLGYDHIEEKGAEEMEALEKDILATLGIDDPYRDPS